MLGVLYILRSTTAPKGQNDAFHASWSTTNLYTMTAVTVIPPFKGRFVLEAHIPHTCSARTPRVLPRMPSTESARDSLSQGTSSPYAVYNSRTPHRYYHVHCPQSYKSACPQGRTLRDCSTARTRARAEPLLRSRGNAS
jgi:hypothetical protein